MRTRSQPQSPGGFISLETAATSRRTRSTRAASRSASAEPNNQPTTEPPKHQATRSQNQRATRNTSTEKDASASKTVDSTTKTAKTQPRKLTKRDTRKATRKTKATSNKPEESVEEKQPDLSRTDNEDNAEAGAEEPQSGLTTSDTALLEPRTSEREYTASFSTSFSVPQFPLPPFTLPFRSSSPTPSSTSPQKPQESQEVQEPQQRRDRQDQQDSQTDKESQKLPDLSEDLGTGASQLLQASQEPLDPALVEDVTNLLATLDFPDLGEHDLPDLGETPCPHGNELASSTQEAVNSGLFVHNPALYNGNPPGAESIVVLADNLLNEISEALAQHDTTPRTIRPALTEGLEAHAAVEELVVQESVVQESVVVGQIASNAKAYVVLEYASAETPDDLIAKINALLVSDDAGLLEDSQTIEPALAGGPFVLEEPINMDEFTIAEEPVVAEKPAVTDEPLAAEKAVVAVVEPDIVEIIIPKEPVINKGASSIEEQAAPEKESKEEPNPPAPFAHTESIGNQEVSSTSSQAAVAEQSAAEHKETEQPEDKAAVCEASGDQESNVPHLTDAVDPEKKTAVEDHSIHELTKYFAKSSSVDGVSNEAAVSLGEATTASARLPEVSLTSQASTVTNACIRTTGGRRAPFPWEGRPGMASIFDDAPPFCPAMPTMFPPTPVPPPLTLFGSPIPEGPSTIYDELHPPPSLPRIEGVQSVEEPSASVEGPVTHTQALEETPLIQRPPIRPSGGNSSDRRGSRVRRPRQLHGYRHTVLSPIPEEKHHDLMPPSITDQKGLLSDIPLNRKRAHPEPSPEAQAEAAVPSSNKRRNLGTPKSAPRTRASLRRVPRVSYAQRLQRRRAEGQGRIHSTIFRLPEYVAQTEADRLASETASLTSSSAEPLQTTPDFPTEHAQTDDQTASEQSAAPQEPTTPEPAKRSWNLRGIFGSVPRSLSRLFSRSPDKPEDSDTRQPSSERIRRTRLSEASSPVPPPRETQPRRLSSEQPPAKRPRNLSYSLFPAPIDRSLYLGDIPTKSPAKSPVAAAPATASQPAEKETAERPEVREASAPTVDVRGRDATPQATNTVSESQKKKRKRSPSPDIIPNPPGSSYGLDLDYFCYSSDSEEDEAQSPEPVAPQTEPRKSDGLTKTALRSVFQTERPASKKVRFDASPEDTPSKRRARATDPYHGAQFVGFPHASPTPTTPTPASREYDEPQRRPGFVPNKTGTFELNYDDFSDDSDSSGIASPTSIPAPSPASVAPTPPQPSTPQSSLPAPRTIGRPAQPPSTPVRVDEEALARARSQAEKYKPKTPSGLRTASRYSSPLTATPDITPARPIAQPAVHAATQPTAQPAEDVTEKFGDDQFAEDAKWLYENCPSGDLRQLVWPEPQNLAESLNISAEAVRILDEIWDPADVDKAYEIFKREFEDFKKTLAEGTA